MFASPSVVSGTATRRTARFCHRMGARPAQNHISHSGSVAVCESMASNISLIRRCSSSEVPGLLTSNRKITRVSCKSFRASRLIVSSNGQTLPGTINGRCASNRLLMSPLWGEICALGRSNENNTGGDRLVIPVRGTEAIA